MLNKKKIERKSKRGIISFSFTVTGYALTAVGALRALIDFTLSNARQFYPSMGSPLAVKGLMFQFIYRNSHL